MKKEVKRTTKFIVCMSALFCCNREQGQPGAANSDSKSEAGAFDTGIA